MSWASVSRCLAPKSPDVIRSVDFVMGDAGDRLATRLFFFRSLVEQGIFLPRFNIVDSVALCATGFCKDGSDVVAEILIFSSLPLFSG